MVSFRRSLGYSFAVNRTTPWGLFGLVFFAATFGHEDTSSADDTWGKDKAYHLVVSFSLASTWSATLWALGNDPLPIRLAMSSSFSLLPGVFKEIYDSGQPGKTFSGKDLLWDVIGTAAGSLLIYAIELCFTHVRKKTVSAHKRTALHSILTPDSLLSF
jgi:uncharacterized protein YfiM (DUF2279 family)